MDKKEIVILMGYPCAGKSTVVKAYVNSFGHTRLNRDDEGGSLSKLHTKLEKMICDGSSTKFVLDNTYGTKEQRAEVISIAKKNGFDVICNLMDTSIEDAQFNSAWRILSSKWGNNADPNLLLGPNSSKLFPSSDNVPAIALFAYRKSYEAPHIDEGFTGMTLTSFKRKFPDDFKNKAILLDYDGTLRTTTNKLKYPTDPSEVTILPNRTKVLKVWQKKGYKLLGVSNQSGVEKGKLTDEQALECFNKTNELLGLDIEVVYCPHHSFPIRCYCRKPMSGLGVYHIRNNKLNPYNCIFVGDATSDKTFAKRCGFQYQDEKEFFRGN